MSEYKESQHKLDSDGKFSSTGGVGSSGGKSGGSGGADKAEKIFKVPRRALRKAIDSGNTELADKIRKQMKDQGIKYDYQDKDQINNDIAGLLREQHLVDIGLRKFASHKGMKSAQKMYRYGGSQSGIEEGLTEHLAGSMGGSIIKKATGYSGRITSKPSTYKKQRETIQGFFSDIGSDIKKHLPELMSMYLNTKDSGQMMESFVQIAKKQGVARAKAYQAYFKMQSSEAI